MRERLTLAFVVVTLVLLSGAGLVRHAAIQGDQRARASDQVAGEAQLMAVALARAVEAPRGVRRSDLERLLVPGVGLRYEASDRRPVVLTSEAYPEDAERDDVVSASVRLGGGTLTVARVPDTDVEDTLWRSDWTGMLALLALIGLVAALTGYLVARALSAPFRQLATAAAALGRGRTDLDLPATRVPEARAIAQALASSAEQLRDRVSREREFGQHTSHVLRTPLTALRMRLEEMTLDPSLAPDVRQAVEECLRAVADLNDVAGELVEISGRGVLVEGAAMPLRDLATQVSQRWADDLDEHDRDLTAAVEGDMELMFTPGPVEQVLDRLLEDVVRHETGDVRLVFEGAASRLRIDVLRTDPAPARLDRVQAVLAGLGGRLEEVDGTSFRIHLPRR